MLIKNFTPEETETLNECMYEFKANMWYYNSIFLTSGLAFNFWQRSFVPLKFYPFTITLSLLAGTFFAALKSNWYTVEMMDKLG